MLEINDFFSIYKDAVWNKDPELMLTLYENKVTIFDMWNKGYIATWQEWTEIINSWLTSLGDEQVRVDFEKVHCHQSADAGFATALIQFKALSKEGKRAASGITKDKKRFEKVK